MRFTQPNSRARAMHHVVDQLITGASIQLRFQTETEASHGLEALHEVAVSRRIGILVEPTGPQTIEVRLAADKAA